MPRNIKIKVIRRMNHRLNLLTHWLKQDQTNKRLQDQRDSVDHQLTQYLKQGIWRRSKKLKSQINPNHLIKQDCQESEVKSTTPNLREPPELTVQEFKGEEESERHSSSEAEGWESDSTVAWSTYITPEGCYKYVKTRSKQYYRRKST